MPEMLFALLEQGTEPLSYVKGYDYQQVIFGLYALSLSGTGPYTPLIVKREHALIFV